MADHILVGMCYLWGAAGRTGNSSVENSSLGDLSWVGGSVQENVLIGSLASMPPLGTSGGSTHPTLLAPPPPARAAVAETGLQLPDAVTAPGPPRFAPPSAPPPHRPQPRSPRLLSSSLLPPPAAATSLLPPPDRSRRRHGRFGPDPPPEAAGTLQPGLQGGDGVGALGRGRAERRRTCARVGPGDPSCC